MSTALSMGIVRGMLTLVLMLAFIGMVIYVYSKRNKSTYDQAARLPLEDSPSAISKREGDDSSRSPQS